MQENKGKVRGEMSLQDLAHLGPAINVEGSKIGAFLQFVRRTYGLEKREPTEAECTNITQTFKLKDNETTKKVKETQEEKKTGTWKS